MQIYVDLFYRNIEGFLSSTFPVARTLFEDERWHAMVRDFVHRHVSDSPYFMEIPQEFLEYLANERDGDGDPEFLLELCHYEWVELDLDLSPESLPPRSHIADLLAAHLVVSPLARSLRYAFPVHQLGKDNQPDSAPAAPTFLIVYRNRHDRVRFMESNAVTARLLQLLPEYSTAREALHVIAGELDSSIEAIEASGTKILGELVDRDIISADS